MSYLKKRSLLWKVRSGSTPWSYLYGTMHIRDKRAFSYIEKIKPFLNDCDLFAAELTLDQTKRNTIFEAAQLPEGVNISNYCGDRQYNNLKKRIRNAFKMDLDDYRKVRPVILTSVLTASVLSLDYSEGLDQYLWNYAIEKGKTCKGLEDLEYQIQLLQKIPITIQVRMLRNIAGNTPKFRKQIVRMVQMYEEGDICAIHRNTRKFLGNMRKWLLYDRNIVMTEQICSFMKEHTVFATFGAGHLSGSRGIIRLLKKKGYEVKPVKLD